VRPLTLTISGFRSHQAETTISFEDRSLVAIVGPTGAGKSSILDAVVFALYGKTPRIQRSTTRLICLRSDAARVRFRFAIEKDEYEITRVLRRAGGGEHLLVDLGSGERTTGDRAVNQKVLDLLGLDFDAFCSSVLLAQGKFSRFLEAAPTEQMKILKGVFRVDQIDALRDAAKSRVSALDGDLREIEGARGEIPDDLEGELQARRAEAASLRERLGALTKAVSDERKLVEEARVARDRVERADRESARLIEAARRLPRRERLDEMIAAESDFARRREQLEADAAEHAAASDEARRTFAALERDLGTLEKLAGLRGACATLDEAAGRIERLRLAIAAADEKSKAAAAALEAAVRATAEAVAERGAAGDALAELERAHRAHVLRRDLAPGEPCPVCEQTVAEVPEARPPKALSTAEKRFRAAEKGVAEREREERRAEAASVEAQAELQNLSVRLEEEAEERARRRAAIERDLGVHEDPAGEVESRCRRLEEARKTAREREEAAARASAQVAALRDEERRLDTSRTEIAAAIVHVAGLLGEAPPPAALTAADLVQRVEEASALVAARREESQAEGRDARAAAAAVDEGLAALRARLDLPASASIAAAEAEARDRAARVDERVSQLEALEAKATVLAEREKTVSRERTLYARLAGDLTDRGFIKFLLEDRRRLLSELGSEQLRMLTGRYRFDDELEFNVVDELDGDKHRDIVTLSGGELFLASLALALALADAVSRHGGRLECFFLDEGFGALDPESLDLALDGIEQIVRPERLVALVSHVQALAQRVEDKIVLERTPEGMTLLSEGAGV